MKKIISIISVLILFATIYLNAKTYVILNNQYTFSPASLTIEAGDTVKFQIGSSHNAVEVSKETYDKKDTVSNGGFKLPFGGGLVQFPTEGTYYYVCAPHAKFGMIGMIEVKTKSTGLLNTSSKNEKQLIVYPNPASDYVNIKAVITSPTDITLQLYDITGKLVQQNIDEEVSEGEYNRLFNINKEIKPGKYFMQLNCKQGCYRQIMIIR